MMSYETLESKEIVTTIARLQERIEDRFPESGLAQVCGRLLAIAENMETRVRWISKPVTWLRVTVWTLVAIIIGVFAEVMWITEFRPQGWGGKEVVEIMDSGFNVAILIGAAIFFLFSLETRFKRGRALGAIHELRSVAHIVDMHQLTKDPERLLSKRHFQSEISPKMSMTQFELRRYLDYSSEMLSLIGKVAAVYIQSFDDTDAVSAASELEILSTGLSRKIWQKILILHTFVEGNDRPPQSTIIRG